MTGYGLFRGQTADVSIEISIRSVNGRFLENRFHLPKAFYGYESELKKKLGEFVKEWDKQFPQGFGIDIWYALTDGDNDGE